MALEFTKTASIVNDAFTNLPRPEMAAGTLAEKSPATILPLGKDGTVTSCCNSGVILRESAARSSTGGHNLEQGLWP